MRYRSSLRKIIFHIFHHFKKEYKAIYSLYFIQVTINREIFYLHDLYQIARISTCLAVKKPKKKEGNETADCRIVA